MPVSLNVSVSVSTGPGLILVTYSSAGLDPERYRGNPGESEERAFSTLDSQISDTDRFKDSIPFLIRCRHCQGQVPFEPISNRDVRPQLLIRCALRPTLN